MYTGQDIFFQDTDIRTAKEAITGSIFFSVERIIHKEKKPQKTKKYPNNKFHMEIREYINRKKTAFKSGNAAGVRAAQKDLKQRMRVAQLQHREQTDRDLSRLNNKRLWDS